MCWSTYDFLYIYGTQTLSPLILLLMVPLHLLNTSNFCPYLPPMYCIPMVLILSFPPQSIRPCMVRFQFQSMQFILILMTKLFDWLILVQQDIFVMTNPYFSPFLLLNTIQYHYLINLRLKFTILVMWWSIIDWYWKMLSMCLLFVTTYYLLAVYWRILLYACHSLNQIVSSRINTMWLGRVKRHEDCICWRFRRSVHRLQLHFQQIALQ